MHTYRTSVCTFECLPLELVAENSGWPQTHFRWCYGLAACAATHKVSSPQCWKWRLTLKCGSHVRRARGEHAKGANNGFHARCHPKLEAYRRAREIQSCLHLESYRRCVPTNVLIRAKVHLPHAILVLYVHRVTATVSVHTAVESHGSRICFCSRRYGAELYKQSRRSRPKVRTRTRLRCCVRLSSRCLYV